MKREYHTSWSFGSIRDMLTGKVIHKSAFTETRLWNDGWTERRAKNDDGTWGPWIVAEAPPEEKKKKKRKSRDELKEFEK